MELPWWMSLLLLAVAVPLLPSEAEIQPRFSQAIGNQEVVASRNAALKCVVENLGHYKVAWIHLERQMIITIHNNVITSIPRFWVVREDPNTWVLHISQVQPSDGGLYMCQVNTVPLMSQIGSLEVFEAPEFVDANSSKSEVSVRSRNNVTLTCAARGVPSPTIRWSREDGRPLRAAVTRHGRHGHRGRQHGGHGRQHGHGHYDQHGHYNQHGQYDQHGGHGRLIQYGGEHDEDATGPPMVIKGNTLHLVHVTPSDMGAYLCIAKNDIPPAVSKRIQLFVEFKPMIWVPSQVVGGARGSSVTLQCRSEAHPKPIAFWMKTTADRDQLIIVKQQGKYDIEVIPAAGNVYEMEMRLTIQHLNESDFGSYKCVCKNYIGEVDGSITLNEIRQPTTEPATTERHWPRQPPTDTDTDEHVGGERKGHVLPGEEELEERLEEEVEEIEREWEQRRRQKEVSSESRSSSPETRPGLHLLRVLMFALSLTSLL